MSVVSGRRMAGKVALVSVSLRGTMFEFLSEGMDGLE